MARPVPDDAFGEMTGDVNATSLHSLSGDVPMQARKWQKDQPLIRREPSMETGDPDGVKAAEEPIVPEEKQPVAVAAEPVRPKPAEVKPSPSPEPPKPVPAAERPSPHLPLSAGSGVSAERAGCAACSRSGLGHVIAGQGAVHAFSQAI